MWFKLNAILHISKRNDLKSLLNSTEQICSKKMNVCLTRHIKCLQTKWIRHCLWHFSWIWTMLYRSNLALKTANVLFSQVHSFKTMKQLSVDVWRWIFNIFNLLVLEMPTGSPFFKRFFFNLPTINKKGIRKNFVPKKFLGTIFCLWNTFLATKINRLKTIFKRLKQ